MQEVRYFRRPPGDGDVARPLLMDFCERLRTFLIEDTDQIDNDIRLINRCPNRFKVGNVGLDPGQRSSRALWFERRRR